MLIDYKGCKPKVAKDCFISPGAQLIGAVELDKGASIWFNAVLRADEEKITVGERSNVQDGCVLHQDIGLPLIIGKGVTVGHNAILHGCTIGDNVLVGMGATILNGAKIGAGTIVGAGALVTQGKEIPPNSLVVGTPAKVVRQLTAEETASIRESENIYYEKAQTYLKAEAQELIEAAKCKAGGYFKEGYNCAEATLKAFNELLEMGLPPGMEKIATGFGGGMGRAGCACGALVGGNMAIGLLLGRTSNTQDRMPAYTAAKELHHRFQEKFGSTCCRVLNPGADFASDDHKQRCLKYTGNSAGLVMEYLLELKKQYA